MSSEMSPERLAELTSLLTGQTLATEPQAYTAQQVFAVLKALGYGAGQADLAMSRAITRGSWPLSRHVVAYDGETGTYEITPGSAS